MTADPTARAGARSTTGAAPQAGAGDRRCYSFPDLGATIDCDDFSADLAGELPDRYDSCFCVAEYFDIYDRPTNVSTCQLDEPRHVIVFTVKGATAEILNKVVDIEPEAVERATTAIFRAHPRVHRVQAEIKFAPAELRRPARQLLRADDFVVTLPATLDEYNKTIGSTTRKHLRQYGNGLVRRHPDFALSTLERGEIPRELVDQVIAWHLERMRAKGVVSMWEDSSDAPDQLWRLLQAHGCALCGSIEGRCAAAQLLLFVGRDCWVHTVGFDSAYENEHLGLLMTSYSIAESISRGCAQTHLTWGTDVYKRRLGAVPVPAYRVSIYRSRLWKTLYRRERWTLLVKHRHDVYWRARTALTARLPHVSAWYRGLKARRQAPAKPPAPGRPPVKES